MQVVFSPGADKNLRVKITFVSWAATARRMGGKVKYGLLYRGSNLDL